MGSKKPEPLPPSTEWTHPRQEKRPTSPPPPPKACAHEFQHIETIKRTESGGYNIRFVKIDRFYCRHCLATQETKKEEWSREAPEWY